VPPDAFEELFDRERLLAGLPAKRANTLLFLIESRTARLVTQSRETMARFASREAQQQRELEFIEAFALGRDPPARPSIQDLERQAPRWASLVARNARVQAALAHRIGEKYCFSRRHVGGMRKALGLDDPRVAAAYETLYAQPLDSIYVARPPPLERLRWARAAAHARLEDMSPFWTAYALTLTETVGSAIVALPIAVAVIGPLAGVAILVVLGLVNVLTVAFMADALTRSATMRYGNAYLGRFVTDLLGRPAALVLSAGLAAICVLVIEADYIGFSTLLTDATGVATGAWVTLLFAIQLYYLRRGSIAATATSALLVGAVNIALILAICALAFAHVHVSNLGHVELPFVGGTAFDRASLALVFGVVFTAFFGHLSVGNCARVVLAREPSGRTLVHGVAAAQLTAMALYALFVVAVSGAVGSSLVGAQGTALPPLADEAGPAVLVFGAVFVVLAMGMASIHFALGLFYLVRERLPSRAPQTLVLPRRAARVLLEGHSTTVAMTYLGLGSDGAARVRLDVRGRRRARCVEATAQGQWEPFAEAPLDDLAEHGLELHVVVLAASDHELRAEVSSSMRLSYEGAWDTAGVSLAAILALEDREADALAWILRRTDASPAEVAEHAGQSIDDAAATLATLAEQGLVAQRVRGGELRYVAHAGRRRGGRLSTEVWDALRGPGEDAPRPAPDTRRGARRRDVVAARARGALGGERSRFVAGVSPVAAAFAIALWQASSATISLAEVVSFVGVIAVALLAGVFPVLLLVAARNKGELPAWNYRLPAQRWLLVVLYAIALGGVALHGLVLWADPLQRAVAIGVTGLALAMTASMVRSGTLAPRATIELREDGADDPAQFSIVTAGAPTLADVVLEYEDGERCVRADAGEIPAPSSLRRAVFAVDWTDADRPPRQVKIVAHRVSHENDSVPLDVQVQIDPSGESRPITLDARGEVVYELDARRTEVAVISQINQD
jgi:hypothetical protein